MKLGKLQKLWIKTLKNYPERQHTGSLGYINGDEIKLCCLGQLHKCYHELNNLPFSLNDTGDVIDYGTDMYKNALLTESYLKYGLRDTCGELKDFIKINNKTYSHLSNMNDDGLT